MNCAIKIWLFCRKKEESHLLLLQQSPSAGGAAAAWQEQPGQSLGVVLGRFSGLTDDAELGAGEDDAVPVLGHALVHPRVRQAHVGDGEGALLQLHSALGEQQNKPQNEQGNASSEHKHRGCCGAVIL